MRKNNSRPHTTPLLSILFFFLFWVSHFTSFAQPLSGILPKYDAYLHQAAVDFQWNSMPNAVEYRVVLAADPAFTQNVFQSTPQVGTSWTSEPLTFGTWYWKVVGSDGVENTESATNKFVRFDPSQDPNLVLWLKSDAGILLDVNNKVQVWMDQSPNAYQLQQTTDAKKPTNNMITCF